MMIAGASADEVSESAFVVDDAVALKLLESTQYSVGVYLTTGRLFSDGRHTAVGTVAPGQYVVHQGIGDL